MITTNAFDYINVLDKAADASWLRETAIMNNLANTNTPGYKRQEVDFESVLQRELGHSKYTTLDKKIRSLNADLSGLNVSTYTDSSNYSYRLVHCTDNSYNFQIFCFCFCNLRSLEPL